MNTSFERLEAEGAKKIGQLGTTIEALRFVRYVEMRYQRQEYTVKVKLPGLCNDAGELRRWFEETYERRFGHASKEIGVDVVMLRVVVGGVTPRPQDALPSDATVKTIAAQRRKVWFESTGVRATSGNAATCAWVRSCTGRLWLRKPHPRPSSVPATSRASTPGAISRSTWELPLEHRTSIANRSGSARDHSQSADRGG